MQIDPEQDFDLDTLQADLYNQLKEIPFDKDEPYFMINLKAKHNEKCFLTTNDINRHQPNGALRFPKTFCRMLYDLALPIQKDNHQIEQLIETFIDTLKHELVTFADNLGKEMNNFMSVETKRMML